MKKIKYENKPWCTFCQPGQTRAVWQEQTMHRKAYACDAHQKDLRAKEVKDAQRDSHLTEADYQTWMRL